MKQPMDWFGGKVGFGNALLDDTSDEAITEWNLNNMSGL